MKRFLMIAIGLTVVLATFASCAGAARPVAPEYTLIAAADVQPLSYSDTFEADLHTSLQDPSVWDGSKDTSWTGGEIQTAAQFAQFLELVNAGTTFEGQTVTLSTDVDCNGKTLSLGSKPFAGTLNGQGHAVSNFVMTFGGSSIRGFFGSLTGNAAVRDLTLMGSFSSNNTSSTVPNAFGMLAGEANPGAGNTITVENVYCTTSFTTDSDMKAPNQIGGLIGRVNTAGSVVVRNCVYNGTIDVKGSNTGKTVGGLIGYTNVAMTALTFDNCHVTLTTNTGGETGGLLGKANAKIDTLTVRDCLVDGSITAPDFSGGLIGYLINTGTFTMSGSSLNGSFKSGRVSGGLVGTLVVSGTASTISDCSLGADADVQLTCSGSATECGGLVGRLNSNGATASEHAKLTVTGAEMGGTLYFSAQSSSADNLAGVMVGKVNTANTDVEFAAPSVTGHVKISGNASADVVSRVRYGVLVAGRAGTSNTVTWSDLDFRPVEVWKGTAYGATQLKNCGYDADGVNQAVGYQTRANDDGTYDIRFVFALKMEDHFYDELGVVLHVESGENSADREQDIHRIYTSVLGGGKTYTAEELGGTYLYTVTLENIPETVTFAQGNLSVTLTPYSKLCGCKTTGTAISNSGDLAE